LILAELLESFAVTSWTFQALLVCTAQFQLCQDLVLAATISLCCKDFKAIAARWIILWQNESNRKRTAYRARADRARG
jgi:hypothetical protein